MFPKMRRFKQELSKETCEAILKEETYGTLAVISETGYPYSVPVNYHYEDGKILFHGANVGHKMDCLRGNSKVSFSVVSKSDIIKEEYTCHYQSVIAFGTARILDDPDEIYDVTERIALRFWPEDEKEHRDALIKRDLKQLGVVEITVDHLSGKQHMSLFQ